MDPGIYLCDINSEQRSFVHQKVLSIPVDQLLLTSLKHKLSNWRTKKKRA